MTPATRVMIYEDPITQKVPEGRGRLIEKLCESFGQEFWRVRFMDGMECMRWVKVEEEK